MTQSRIHDYRSPRSSADLNKKLVVILPAGVYGGFNVHGDGTIDSGVLLTADGVRIEEDEVISVTVPAGDITHPRLDLVVCIHEYLPTYPNVTAHFEVVEGIPATSPNYPDISEHAILLAKCRIETDATSWSEVINVGPPVGTAPELAGANRSTETVKDNADAISDHVNETSGAHQASEISTEAVSGSPFSLTATESQTALAALVSGMNQRALKSGDTFSGAMTFQSDVTFDADDVDDVKFDEDIWFFRTISAFAGRGIESGGFTTAYLNDTFGGLQFSQVGHNILIPVHGIASCKISKVRFYFQVPPDTSGRATLLLRVTSTPSYYSGEESSPINTPIEFELQTSDPANAYATHWATYMHEIDCSDLFISGSDFTKMMFATVIMTEAASHALVFPGVKVAYKRTKMTV